MARSPSPLPPEFAVFAACALLEDIRLAEAAPPLLQRPGFDWDRFVDLGVFHGVEQVARARLERTMPGAIPAGQATRLQRRLVQGAALNAAHAHMAVRVVGMLEQAGIPALVLKGAALAGQLYAPQPDLRVSSDVDIVIAPEVLRAADGSSAALVGGRRDCPGRKSQPTTRTPWRLLRSEATEHRPCSQHPPYRGFPLQRKWHFSICGGCGTLPRYGYGLALVIVAKLYIDACGCHEQRRSGASQLLSQRIGKQLLRLGGRAPRGVARKRPSA